MTTKDEDLSRAAGRRPASVYSVGSDPDARFSLANERTALAWLRTALALVAGGVALTTLASFTHGDRILEVLAALACVAGGIPAISAIFQWRRSERSEEHTSELQSRGHLVCRLLLEKKRSHCDRQKR